jgi:ribosomal protein S18 acetylase RimI-like enzyme
VSRHGGSIPEATFELGAQELAVGASRLACSLVPWDTATFGFPVAQVTEIELGTSATAADELLDAFEAWLRDNRIRLVSCRLDHRKLRESMALEARGFRFIEMVYRPQHARLDAVARPAHPIDVRPAATDDLAAVEEIAATAFTTGRFLLDERLPPALSHRRYASWVRSSAAERSQRILVAELGGGLVGFFIVERFPDGRVYWHLTAIHPAWQGKGLGASLWQTMLRRHAAEGATTVETTISAHNLPALNLYARLGFTFPSASLTLHRLVDWPA